MTQPPSDGAAAIAEIPLSGEGLSRRVGAAGRVEVPHSASCLGCLPVGCAGVVTRVRAERHLARRLMEMGLLPGTPVSVTRVAPLGDPLELRLRGYALSIRRQEAMQVEIEPGAASEGR